MPPPYRKVVEEGVRRHITPRIPGTAVFFFCLGSQWIKETNARRARRAYRQTLTVPERILYTQFSDWSFVFPHVFRLVEIPWLTFAVSRNCSKMAHLAVPVSRSGECVRAAPRILGKEASEYTNRCARLGGRGVGGGGGAHAMHGRSRMTMDPLIPTIPGPGARRVLAGDQAEILIAPKRRAKSAVRGSGYESHEGLSCIFC